MREAMMALVGACVVLFLLVIYYRRKIDALAEQLEEERFRHKSLSTVYGRISEQWFPLMDAYPYDSQSFRFLGTPVDGIQFEEDRIIFCEFKTNQSGLSPLQRQIKRLVETGQVYWEEFNFTAD